MIRFTASKNRVERPQLIAIASIFGMPESSNFTRDAVVDQISTAESARIKFFFIYILSFCVRFHNLRWIL